MQLPDKVARDPAVRPPTSGRLRAYMSRIYRHWTRPSPAPGWNASQTSFLSVDENGAPVTFEPARWFVCFVPGLKAQFWHRLVPSDYKHVLLLRPNSDGSWTLFEPWWSRLLVRTITPEQAAIFLRWGAMGEVLLVTEEAPGRGSQLRGWMNCVSLAAFVLGRPYPVWSPRGLYRRLSAEPATERIDVSDLLECCIRASASDASAQDDGDGVAGATSVGDAGALRELAAF